ncbi:fucose permease [Anaerotaenia torta]|uniref:MFS transporter n=1 Tax=Anaerotaenia torta TaxID=433293 RepID=UPI003D2365E6
MYSLLLVIIYAAFISLGLPDSLIGSAWPVMQTELGVPVSYAGVITMIIAFGTIISSLFSHRLTRRLGTGLITAISVFSTAAALFGFSVSHSFVWLCLWAVPFGLGAGAVDAALNNYVALHYASRHMSWLHCFWGVGAAVSPYIMSYSLTGGYGWNNGYRMVGIIQITLTVILFISLPLWKGKEGEEAQEETHSKSLSLAQALKIKGVSLILVSFFAYCAVEQTTMLWASSYLVRHRGVDVNTAASFASLFFFGITFGRFLSGFIADKLGDKLLIRIGIFTTAAGVILIALPAATDVLALIGLVVVGFGCAPIYPAIIHSTPSNFGKENSQAIIGIQMACAYVGTTFMPPLFGLIASRINIGLYPFYLTVFIVLMLFMSERLNKIVAGKEFVS